MVPPIVVMRSDPGRFIGIVVLASGLIGGIGMMFSRYIEFVPGLSSQEYGRNATDTTNATYEALMQQRDPTHFAHDKEAVPWLSRLSRVFPIWSHEYNRTGTPCIMNNAPDYDPFQQREQGSPSNDGILFLKVDKAGSSTVAGVGARIAASLANRSAKVAPTENTQQGQHIKACKNRLSHIWSKRMANVIESRNKSNSFLFTIIRDPANRAISDFYYFAVGRDKVKPSEDNLIRYLNATENFNLAKCLTRRKATSTHPQGTYAMDAGAMNEEELQRIVEGVVRGIDFIGTLERLDESMALLQLILELETRDVLFVPANEGRIRKNVTPAVHQYLSGDDWRLHNRGDSLLYRAVNHSLDRTIESFGIERFQRSLAQFRSDEQRVLNECGGPNVSEVERGCYWAGSGCNYKCIDRIFPMLSRL